MDTTLSQVSTELQNQSTTEPVVTQSEVTSEPAVKESRGPLRRNSEPSKNATTSKPENDVTTPSKTTEDASTNTEAPTNDLPNATKEKYAKLESRNAELEKIAAEHTEYKSKYDKLENNSKLANAIIAEMEGLFLKGNKSAYDDFSKAVKSKYNMDLGTYEDAYKEQQQSPNGVQTPAVNTPLISKQDIETTVRDTIKTVTAQQQEFMSDASRFLKAVPEMDFTPEEQESIRNKKPLDSVTTKNEKFDLVVKRYSKDREFYDEQFKGNRGEALAYIYNTLPENLKLKEQKLIEKGEVIGKQNALKSAIGNVGAMGKSEGGTTINVDVYKMTSQQREGYYSILNSSPDEAYKYYNSCIRKNNGEKMRRRS